MRRKGRKRRPQPKAEELRPQVPCFRIGKAEHAHARLGNAVVVLPLHHLMLCTVGGQRSEHFVVELQELHGEAAAQARCRDRNLPKWGPLVLVQLQRKS